MLCGNAFLPVDHIKPEINENQANDKLGGNGEI